MAPYKPQDVSAAPLSEADVPILEPGLGQIRVRVLTCGVCHTDLELPRLPIFSN
jgi:propanol-preferring alcohol dehydrogenase